MRLECFVNQIHMYIEAALGSTWSWILNWQTNALEDMQPIGRHNSQCNLYKFSRTKRIVNNETSVSSAWNFIICIYSRRKPIRMKGTFTWQCLPDGEFLFNFTNNRNHLAHFTHSKISVKIFHSMKINTIFPSQQISFFSGINHCPSDLYSNPHPPLFLYLETLTTSKWSTTIY